MTAPGGADTYTNVENVIGGSGDDTLTGTDSTTVGNALTGGAGDDTLTGGAGDDILDGGAHGSVNGDTVDFKNGTNGVTASLADGTATDSEGGNDTLQNIENLTGTDSVAMTA